MKKESWNTCLIKNQKVGTTEQKKVFEGMMEDNSKEDGRRSWTVMSDEQITLALAVKAVINMKGYMHYRKTIMALPWVKN